MGLVPASLSKALLRLWVAVFMAAALGGCATSPTPLPHDAAPSAMPGDFVDAGGRQLLPQTFAQMAAPADFVLLGEGHSNACDHNVQAEALRILDDAAKAAGAPRPVIGLEMVPQSRQDVLNRFNAGALTPDTLESALDWENVWGFAYSLYAPIIRVAHERGLPLVGLNVPRGIARKVGRVGIDGMSEDERRYLPEKLIPPHKDQYASLREEFDRHGQLMKRDGDADAEFERFMTVQSVWDTVMAEAAASAHKTYHRPVVIIVGGGHVEFGWGIEHRLNVLAPSASVFSLAPWRGLEPADPAVADAFFYCPLSHESRLGFTVELRPEGAAVMAVKAGSRAEKAGMLAGDVIVQAQGDDVDALWALHKAAVRANREADGRMRLTLRRGGKDHDIIIQLTRTRPHGVSPPRTDHTK